MSKTHRLKTYLKKHGIKTAFINFILYILNPVVSFRTVYLINIDDVDWAGFHDDRFAFDEMSLSDLDALLNQYPEEFTKSRYDFLKGVFKDPFSVCYRVSDRAGHICAYNCMAFSKPELNKIFSKIKGLAIEKNGYIFREYTFRKFRNQGVQTFAYFKWFHILKNKGFETAVIRVAKLNFASEHTCEKIGFKKALLEIHIHFFHLFPKSNFILIRA